jgi:hypothetical protein
LQLHTTVAATSAALPTNNSSAFKLAVICTHLIREVAEQTAKKRYS